MIGKNIKNFREAKGMTQDTMAEKLNVTRQAVSNWETGKTEPDLETLKKIADLLEVSVEELIYGVKQQRTTIVNNQTIKNVTQGLSFGAALAMIISYANWHSIGWAILHGLFNWGYVIYYIIKYGWN